MGYSSSSRSAKRQSAHQRAAALLQRDPNRATGELLPQAGEPVGNRFGRVFELPVFGSAVGKQPADGMFAVGPIEADQHTGIGVEQIRVHGGSSPVKVKHNQKGHAILGAGENLIVRDVLASSSGVIRWFPRASSRSKVWAQSLKRWGARFVAGRRVPDFDPLKVGAGKTGKKRRWIGSGAEESVGRDLRPPPSPAADPSLSKSYKGAALGTRNKQNAIGPKGRS